MSITQFPKTGVIGANLKPKRYDIEIYQGDTFAFFITLKDANGVLLDITGWTVKVDIRKQADNSLAESPNFTTSVEGASGKIYLRLEATESDLLQGDVAYKYDVQVTDTSGNRRTYIGGEILVTEDVTE